MIGVNDVLFDAPFTPAIEIGWRLDQKFWRCGLAAEGATAVLNFAFSTLKLKEVVAFTSKINYPSMKLMEKIGMRRDEKGDFNHPNLEEGNPLRQHVLYRIPLFPKAFLSL
jgi:RimJ/RimL family protein N-acetyltransferase